jgi:hypothetical protein
LKTAFRALTLYLFALAACSFAYAQAIPTAERPFTLSAFGAATGTFTGLDQGKNLGITAGADITFRPYHFFYFSGEVRGTYPIDNGQIDSQKNVLIGPKVQRYYGHFHPYIDALYGRAKIDYANGGFPNPAGTLLFIDSITNVYSFGGGLDYVLTDHFDIKLDGQFQHNDSPVVSSGVVYAKPLSIGVVYRFGAPSLNP